MGTPALRGGTRCDCRGTLVTWRGGLTRHPLAARGHASVPVGSPWFLTACDMTRPAETDSRRLCHGRAETRLPAVALWGDCVLKTCPRAKPRNWACLQMNSLIVDLTMRKLVPHSESFVPVLYVVVKPGFAWPVYE